MANVNVTMYVKYKVTQKSGNKEIAQKFTNTTIYLGDITEAQWTELYDVTKAAVNLGDVLGD